MTGARKMVFCDLGGDAWQLLCEDDLVEIAVERDASGELTPATREKIISTVSAFVSRHQLRPPVPALCAIGGRGVSLRRVKLPPAAAEERERLLALQIETEFPVPPEQLAWGAQPLPRNNGGVLIAAIKKQLLESDREVLARCGLAPRFTIAALARKIPAAADARLDVGRRQSELISFDGGAPKAIRVLPWGAENIASAKADGLVGSLVLGGSANAALAEHISRQFGLRCELAPEQVVKSLQALTAPLVLDGNGRMDKKFADGTIRRTVVLAAILFLAALFFPTVEALIFKPFLARRVAALQAESGRLADIDHETDFLQFLKRNQPPYVDTLYLLAKAAAPGTSFDAVSANRRGELTLHGKMGGAQQVTQFRSKLIESGWFSTVSVDEQTPTPDRRVTVRITAHLKDPEDRPVLAAENVKSKTAD